VNYLLADLTDFLESHRPHSPLAADATTPASNGYLLKVTCEVVTTEEAETDYLN